MAAESRLDGRSGGPGKGPHTSKVAAFGRQENEKGGVTERRVQGTASRVHAELDSARSLAAALLTRPRARCRVSLVQTSRWGLIESADEVLGLMLQRPAKSFIGIPLASVIAGPERRLFGERARLLIEGSDGAEWETRVIAPGARIGVPVAISLERGPEGSLRWYIRDLTELRRAQARIMELEQQVLGS